MPIKVTAAPLSADDRFTFAETAADGPLVLNVRANDGKNSGKPLYSLDNGQAADLVNGDAVNSAADRSALGAVVSINASGSVVYNPAAIQAQIDALAPGQTLQDSFLYAVQTSNTAGLWSTARMTFTGTNDVPVASADVATVSEGTVISGNVGSNDRDVDNGAILTFASARGELPAGFSLNGNGAWIFDANHPAYAALGVGQTLHIPINYAVTDQYGASAGSSLTITVTGTNDAPAAQATSAAAMEGSQIGGQVAASDADAGAVLTYAVAGDAPAGFVLGSDGAWTFNADYASYNGLAVGQAQTVVLNYSATDQHGASSRSSVVVTVTGSNDGPVAAPANALAVEDASVSGRLLAADADGGAVLGYALLQDAPAGFSLVGDGGWTFDAAHPAYQDLGPGETRSVMLNFVVSDEHGATSSSTLTLIVTGTNDAPSAVPADAATAEDGQVAGRLVATDVDGGALRFALAGDAPEGFTLSADGAWSFDATGRAWQALREGEAHSLSVPVTVVDGQGGSTSASLHLTITGRDDGATVTGDLVLMVTEDDVHAAGDFLIRDPDRGEADLAERKHLEGRFGVATFVPTDTGEPGTARWSYDVRDGAALQSLAQGETVSDSFTLLSTGGTPLTFTVTIAGANDAPTADAAHVCR